MSATTHRLLEQALRNGKVACLEVSGGCMHPLIHSGDTVVVAGSSPPRVGQVVVAVNQAGDFVCHRLLGTAPGGLLVAGDRSRRPELHPADTVLGRVTEVRPGGGERSFRLDRRSRFDAIAAGLHRRTYHLAGGPAGRALDVLRRAFWTVRAITLARGAALSRRNRSRPAPARPATR